MGPGIDHLQRGELVGVGVEELPKAVRHAAGLVRVKPVRQYAVGRQLVDNDLGPLLLLGQHAAELGIGGERAKRGLAQLLRRGLGPRAFTDRRLEGTPPA